MADKTILVVDDEQDVRTYLTTLFSDNGYKTVQAVDGNEAMEKVKAEKPDLITLDISMPEKSGVRFYKELRDNDDTRDLPVIVVTGVTGFGDSPEVFQKFLESRRQFPAPNAFIPKPVEQADILAEIKKLIG